MVIGKLMMKLVRVCVFEALNLLTIVCYFVDFFYFGTVFF